MKGALSKFFGYAVKQRWAVDNPVRNVTIPSDADAIRIHVLTPEEERELQTEYKDLGTRLSRLEQPLKPQFE